MRLSFLTLLSSITLSLIAQTPSSEGAVLVSAIAQQGPASITLNWPAFSGASSYRVYKRVVGNSSWGNSLSNLSGSATSYTDNVVIEGQLYEYKVQRNSTNTGYGYVRSAINLDAGHVHFRGKMILLIDSAISAVIGPELEQLEIDLIGDGWYPQRVIVGQNATPPTVRAQIIAAHNSDPSLVNALYIIGHVPVPYTGNSHPDGHTEHKGAWACDGYYGELDGSWTDNSVNITQSTTLWNHNIPGDGKFDQVSFPSDVELMIGRVDMHNLPAYTQTEVQLLKAYLNKAHEFKIRLWEPPTTALAYEKLNWVGDPLASSGYSSMAAMVGAGSFNDVNIFAEPWENHRSVPHLINYHSDGGTQSFEQGTVIFTGMNMSSIDSIVAHPMGSVFHMTFGSYFGDWDNPNNYLRALLGSGNSLASMWSGQPNWFLHPMAMGAPIGECARLSMNNTNANYSLQNGGWWSQDYTSTHMGLMGDPSLRMKMITPPIALNATNDSWYIKLNWDPSPDNVQGYYLYHIIDSTGVIQRISSLLSDTTFTSDSILFQQGDRYMVRGSKMDTTASGIFENLSLGVVANADGVVIPDCEGTIGGNALPGAACDDGDPLTANDAIDANCNCLGELADCNGLVGGPDLPGTPCDDGDASTGSDSYQSDCSCVGLPLDCEGTPGGNALPGSPCNDNSNTTANDTFDANCNCTGQPIDCEGVFGGNALPGTPCDDADVSTGNDVYQNDCSCSGQLIDCNGVIGGVDIPGAACDDGDATTGNDMLLSDCSCAGLTLDCEGVSGGGAIPGAACDDNEVLTGNDSYDSNCNCVGQPIDCEGLIGGSALPGTACDDGDAATGNDIYQNDCTCLGLLIDCEGVIGGSALPGTACDDNDANTGIDTFQSDCSCVGVPLDCEGTPGGSVLAGSPCDDADLNTVNDVYDGNCNCIGSPCDPNNPDHDCDPDNDGVRSSVDLDDDNDGILDVQERTDTTLTITVNEQVWPFGYTRNFTIDLSAYNVPIGNTVHLSNFRGEGNMDKTNERFDLDFNNGVLLFDRLSTDEECTGIIPISDNPFGSLSTVDIGGGLSGLFVTSVSSKRLLAINNCTEVDLVFDITTTISIDLDTDGDSVVNALDSDSDGDGCPDVVEATFGDPDNDGFLGSSPITVDADGLVTSATDGYTGTNPNINDPDTFICVFAPEYISIAAKVFLEGPFDVNTGIMHDSLRSKGLIPLHQPYTTLGHSLDSTALDSIDATILSITGTDAIVDWILVELRDTVNPSLTRSAVPALLQRDGDIVRPEDGHSPLRFNWSAQSYHIVIRHRNHLGCMSDSAYALSTTPLVLDLTTSNILCFGSEARHNDNGIMLLWSGNALHDSTIKYVGLHSDRDPILAAVGGSNPTVVISAYATEDVNMDGLVKYIGAANDRDPILVNVGGGVPTAVRVEQVP